MVSVGEIGAFVVGYWGIGGMEFGDAAWKTNAFRANDFSVFVREDALFHDQTGFAHARFAEVNGECAQTDEGENNERY